MEEVELSVNGTKDIKKKKDFFIHQILRLNPKYGLQMNYSMLATLIAWIFPTKSDRSKFRNFCKEIDHRQNIETIKSNHSKIIHYLQQEILKRKLKVVFLNSENSKWSYQYLYEELSKNPNFEVEILLTVHYKARKKKYDFLKWRKLAKDSYEFFKKRNMNVYFAFDFKTMKNKDLKDFNPDIIFYEQPWCIDEKHSVINTSKYALCLYCSYGTCITNGENEYQDPFYKDIHTYFVDNDCIKKILIKNGCREESLVVCGQPKIDAYLKPINFSNIIWKTKNKKRVIWAPHHSFYDVSVLKFGTFPWNYKFLYNFAKIHPEIEFILKPHPNLKRQLVHYGLMSIEEMREYFQNWENLPNSQIYEMSDYFDMFRTSDLLITDCNSFLYEYLLTEKPVIHLINENSVGHNEYGQKIISGYYPVKNLQELESKLNLILFEEQDPLLSVRKNVIKNELIQPNEGVAKYIEKYILNLLKKKVNEKNVK